MNNAILLDNPPTSEVLYIRFLNLLSSLQELCGAVVDFSINWILLLITIFQWIFQFNVYIRYIINRCFKVLSYVVNIFSNQQKLYFITVLVSLWIFFFTSKILYRRAKSAIRNFRLHGYIIIKHFIYILFPYTIFIFLIYFPICILIPKQHFERVIIRIWIFWLPLTKSMITIYSPNNIDNYQNINRSVEGTNFVGTLSWIHKCIAKSINKINNLKYWPSLKYISLYSLPLSLNEPPNYQKKLSNSTHMVCWLNYLVLWLLYFLIKRLVLNDFIQNFVQLLVFYIFKIYISLCLSIPNWLSLWFIKLNHLTLSIHSPRLAFLSMPIVSKLLLFIYFILLEVPKVILHICSLIIFNINWKYILPSILVLNILLELEHEDKIYLRSSISSSNLKKVKNNSVEDSDNDSDNDSDSECNHDKSEYENDNKSFYLINISYPSLSNLCRLKLIKVINWLFKIFTGIDIFPKLNEEILIDTGNTKLSILSRDSYTPKLLHSKTLPVLSCKDNDIKSIIEDNIKNKTSSLENYINNTLVVNWLPKSWNSYYINACNQLIDKSYSIQSYMIYIVIIFSQIPQWIILLLPSFFVNLLGCIVFGYLYPIIMALKIKQQQVEKLQTWLFYFITFLILNEVSNFSSYFNYTQSVNYVIDLIPFKVHLHYIIILVLQFLSFLLPVFLK
ncbi:hypothetical protein ACR3K2_22790 [Cryptosporidium serpentis]